MKICLLGYGKMGHEIEIVGKERGHQFTLIIDENNPEDLNSGKLTGIDAVINFSTPHTAPDQILTCLENGIPVVSGTTGWNHRFDEVRNRCANLNGAFFYASNFSIGVNIFFDANQHLARIMKRFDDYMVSLKEIHHTQKLDAPSGSAITLAEDIIAQSDRIKEWELDGKVKKGSLAIESIREGDIKGFHQVKYESDIDEILISHSAKSRKGFALGAVLAAEFIQGKTGSFGMNDLLNL